MIQTTNEPFTDEAIVADEELVQLIRDKGTKGLNEWRSRCKEECPVIVLNNANLDGVDLTNANLEHANLTNASLRYATLTDAQLSFAFLDEANLQNVHAPRATFTRARMPRINLERGVLLNAKLDHVEAEGAKCIDADFTGADLHNANFRLSAFCEAVLQGANLTDVDLRHATLQDAVFADAILVRTNLCRAHWGKILKRNTEKVWQELEKAAQREEVGTCLSTLKEKPGIRYVRRPGHISARKPRPVPKTRPIY